MDASTREAAVEDAVVRRFDARLSNDLAKARPSVLVVRELPGVDLAKLAEELASKGATWIPPARLNGDCKAAKRSCMLVHVEGESP